jgi:hypothetical protein
MQPILSLLFYFLRSTAHHLGVLFLHVLRRFDRNLAVKFENPAIKDVPDSGVDDSTG